MRIDNDQKTLNDLLVACQDQSDRKADYTAPTTELVCQTVPTRAGNRTQVVVEGSHGESTKVLECNPTAFVQLCNKVNIDIRTARRFRDFYPRVLDLALNSIHKAEPRTVMLRSFDLPRGHILENLDPTIRREFGDGSFIEAPSSTGMLRAVVTNRFKRFDHPDLLEAVLPVLRDSDADWKVVNAAITDKRLYVRFRSQNITGVGAAVGDAMAQGIVISNSETGHGSISIAQLVWTLICLNGMETANKNKSTHLTSALAEGIVHLLTDESKRLDNAALKSKLVDITAAFASREMFEEVLTQFRTAADDHVKNGVAAAQPAVEALGAVMKLTQVETSSVFAGLMETLQQDGYMGQPLSRATLVNAVTAAAKTAKPDDQSEWQRRGGKLLELPRNQWKAIAEVPLAVAA